MSCDWDVYCLDCESSHGFQDTNHEDKLMRELCKIGPSLARLREIWKPIEKLRNYAEPLITLNSNRYGYALSLEWWETHGNHRLVARDEYGRNDDECAEQFTCPKCKHSKWCRRSKGHKGQHNEERDK